MTVRCDKNADGPCASHFCRKLRFDAIRQLRWHGRALPPEVKTQLSPLEQQYFKSYDKLLTKYMSKGEDGVGMDLTLVSLVVDISQQDHSLNVVQTDTDRLLHVTTHVTPLSQSGSSSYSTCLLYTGPNAAQGSQHRGSSAEGLRGGIFESRPRKLEKGHGASPPAH